MKRISAVIIVFLGVVREGYAQSFTVGQACRYKCFGACDNIYQTYFGQFNGVRAYLFDASQGGYHDLLCSHYTESTVLGSCYVEQTGLYYSGFALNITQVIPCPLDPMVTILLIILSVFGYYKIRWTAERASGSS